MDDTAQYLEILSAEDALARARLLAARHYENFAVASFFIPSALRDDFARLYAFCRATDDLGDEWPGDRRAVLQGWRAGWRGALHGDAAPWPLAAAAGLVRGAGLPEQYFDDLIKANLHDQEVGRYPDWEALAGYAALSANPVGRLVLRLFKVDEPEVDRLSDAICTGLQYANFWQDIGVDIGKDRVYLPQCEWRELGEDAFRAPSAPPTLRRILREAALPRTRGLFDQGEELLPRVPARLRRQLTLYLGGGRAILKALERQDCDPLRARPRVSRWRKAGLLLRALAA